MLLFYSPSFCFCFFKHLFIYFIFGCTGSLWLRGLSSRCGQWELLLFVVFSLHELRGSQASVATACVLSSCGSWVLEHRLTSCGYKFSRFTEWEIFLDCGLNPCLLYWQVDSLLLRHQGSPGAQGSLLLIGMCPKGRGEGCFTRGFADSVLCKGSITPSSLSYKSMLPQSSIEEVPIKY